MILAVNFTVYTIQISFVEAYRSILDKTHFRMSGIYYRITFFFFETCGCISQVKFQLPIWMEIIHHHNYNKHKQLQINFLITEG